MVTRHDFARAAMCAAVLMMATGTAAIAAGPQAPAQTPAKDDALQTIPVRIDVMLTRLQGEKKISSLPFSLLANATDNRRGAQSVSIRLGIDVPVGATTETENRTDPAGGGVSRSSASTSTRTQYRSVGTDIDCSSERLDENRFSVRVSISDSSIYSPDGGGKALKDSGPLAFRTFSTRNTVVMRDGQTVLFGTGTDKISGETLKIEVTLHVVK